MNHVERFNRLMAFEPVDRLPVIEWAGWWTKTIDRWLGEGLPSDLPDPAAIRRYLGLDTYLQWWINAARHMPPGAPERSRPLNGLAGYRDACAWLYPESAFDCTSAMGHNISSSVLAGWAAQQQAGEAVIWYTLEGFFWFPRQLLGIENHLYAFYDQPELMHAINQDLLNYNLRVLDEACAICTPQFLTIAEDMSYNHGPMLSKACFDRFLAPYYRMLVPEIKRRGIIPMVDSDGDVNRLIYWLEEVGIEGILPLERMAGTDVARIRREHPRFRLIGAFDKTVMHRGEAAVRHEFERLLPVMVQGGFIPSCDHQTPPEVSLEQYRSYVELLKEYACLAARVGASG